MWEVGMYSPFLGDPQKQGVLAITDLLFLAELPRSHGVQIEVGRTHGSEHFRITRGAAPDFASMSFFCTPSGRDVLHPGVQKYFNYVLSTFSKWRSRCVRLSCFLLSGCSPPFHVFGHRTSVVLASFFNDSNFLTRSYHQRLCLWQVGPLFRQPLCSSGICRLVSYARLHLLINARSPASASLKAHGHPTAVLKRMRC